MPYDALAEKKSTVIHVEDGAWCLVQKYVFPCFLLHHRKLVFCDATSVQVSTKCGAELDQIDLFCFLELYV